jgi:hypothetical protein
MSFPSNSDESTSLLLESLRIQAAAVVAQQTALTELEIRLTDRETALARQESQLAVRLEEQRRELLDLQDQITQARVGLREKRAAFAALSAQHEETREARDRELADRAERVAIRETRIVRLWKQFKNRQRRRSHLIAQERDTAAAIIELERIRITAELDALERERRRFHSRAEIEKRQLAEERSRVNQTQSTTRAHQAALLQQAGELARKAKAIAAERRNQDESAVRAATERDKLRVEIAQLEHRANNARRVLELWAEPIAPVVVAAPNRDGDHEMWLASVAASLADQRLILAEQMECFFRQRAVAVAEIDDIASQLAEREQELELRATNVAAGEQRQTADLQILAHAQHRHDAEQLRAEAALVECEASAGRAVVFASDLDNKWNDFPLHATFVPFIHEVIRYLSGGQRSSDYVIAQVPAGVPPVPGVAPFAGVDVPVLSAELIEGLQLPPLLLGIAVRKSLVLNAACHLVRHRSVALEVPCTAAYVFSFQEKRVRERTVGRRISNLQATGSSLRTGPLR